MESLAQDARHALRALGRHPGFAAAAIGALALGIGANAAMFSVVNAVLVRPLPFTDPDRLVYLRELVNQAPGPVLTRHYDAFARENRSFEGLASHTVFAKNYEGGAEPERLVVISAERQLFQVLGASPLVGRAFQSTDPPNVTVLSAPFWRQRLGGDPSAIGRTIALDGEPYTIIGVMSDDFHYPYGGSTLTTASELDTALWIPFTVSLQQGAQLESVVGRLKAGVTTSAAQAELTSLSAGVDAQSTDKRPERPAIVTPLKDTIVGSSKSSLLMLLGAVAMVLALACANVANLLFARMSVRSTEVAVRSALGAGRGRLVRQFLTESLVLAFAGGLLGALIAREGLVLFVGLAAPYIPRAREITLDWHVFVFFLGICAATGLACGLFPAFITARANLQDHLRESGSRSTATPGQRRWQSALVVAEIALAFVLLVGAGLFLTAFIRLQRIPKGMATDNVITMHLTRHPFSGTYYDIARRVASVPGVRAAGFIQFLPLQNWDWYATFGIDGRPTPPGSPPPRAELRYVTPGYFSALGIPLLRGRNFTESDDDHAPPVIMVNDALVRRYFPSEDPVGRHTNRGTIIGVIGDVREAGLDQPATPDIYYAIMQNAAQTSFVGMSLVVGTNVASESLIAPIRAAVRVVSPTQAIFNVKTMEQVVADSMANRRVYLWLVMLFAAVAFVLAAAGIYGVTTYTVAARMHEFGVRMAIGADKGTILRLVVGEGIRLTAIGVAIGLGGVAVLSRSLAALPYGITAADPTTLAAVTALVSSATLLACAVPARRAASVDPVLALRQD